MLPMCVGTESQMCRVFFNEISHIWNNLIKTPPTIVHILIQIYTKKVQRIVLKFLFNERVSIIMIKKFLMYALEKICFLLT